MYPPRGVVRILTHDHGRHRDEWLGTLGRAERPRQLHAPRGDPHEVRRVGGAAVEQLRPGEGRDSLWKCSVRCVHRNDDGAQEGGRPKLLNWALDLRAAHLAHPVSYLSPRRFATLCHVWRAPSRRFTRGRAGRSETWPPRYWRLVPRPTRKRRRCSRGRERPVPAARPFFAAADSLLTAPPDGLEPPTQALGRPRSIH